MNISNSVSYGSGLPGDSHSKWVTQSRSSFSKMLKEKERTSKEDVLDLSTKDDSDKLSGLSELQAAYLKSKYNVSDMTDEEFGNLLNELSGMGIIPPENAQTIRFAFSLTEEERDALKNHTNSVQLLSKDASTWKASPATDKLSYFELLCQQHLEREGAGSDALKNDQQILDILKLLA